MIFSQTETMKNAHPVINENPKRIVSLANRSQGYSIKEDDVHIVKLIPIPNTSGKMVTENIDNSDVRGAACFINQTRIVTGTIYLLPITITVITICSAKTELRINPSRSSNIFKSNSFPGKRYSAQITSVTMLPFVTTDDFSEIDHTANKRGKATVCDT